MESLAQLSNDQLLTNTRKVVRTERKIMNEVLAHLNEVFRRRLHVEIGYGDFLIYMIKDLGYTESCARQRIAAAKIVREVPKAAAMLDKGDVNMSNLALMQSAIARSEKESGEKVSPEKKEEIVEKLEKKTNAQAQEVLAEEFPTQKVIREKITPIDKDLFRFSVVITRKQKEQLDRMKNVTSHSHFGATWAALQEVAVCEYLKRHDPLEKAARVQSKAEAVQAEKTKSGDERLLSSLSQSKTSANAKTELPNSSQRSRPSTLPLSDTKSVSKPVAQSVSKPVAKTAAKSAARTVTTCPTLNNLSVKSQNSTVQKNSISTDGPTTRAAHHQSYDLSLFDVGSIVIDNAIRSTTRGRTESVANAFSKQVPIIWNRNIPAPVRHAVMLRDLGRCTYIDPVSGRVCGSHFKVQIDHIVPRALGGEDTLENCRCLCQSHNLYVAELVFGKSHMDQYRLT